MPRVQLVLKGLFKRFVAVCVSRYMCIAKSAFFELELMYNVDICLVRSRHGSSMPERCAQALQRELI